MNTLSQFQAVNTMIVCARCWILLLTFFAAGCTGGQAEIGVAKEANVDGAPLSFDAGEMLRGEPARHVFSFTNNASETLTLDLGKDVKKSCGCTRPEVKKLTLQPGETTDVKMLVETDSKTGSFSESTVLLWRDSNGAEYPMSCQLSGRVISPLVFSPTAVLLKTEDLVEGKEFEISVTSELELDWSSAKIIGLTESLSCDYVKKSNGGVIRFRVDKFKQTAPILAEVVCTVAPVWATDDSAPDAAASRRYSGTIPIYMETAETLRLAIDSLQLRADDVSMKYTGSLMILGSADLVPTGDDFITLAGKSKVVEHKIVPITESLFRVDLSIPTTHLTGATVSQELIFRLDGDREVPVRIYLPRS